MERKLTTIFTADVVGYSRLMGEDEDGTIKALKALRKQLVAPLISEHQGRIIKLMGDGLLAEFDSVVEAVKCAFALQLVLKERNEGLAPERQIVLRIGINLGDVIVEDGDIYGEGVNVAARLEAIAPPGGMCVSGTVFDHARDKVGFDFEDLGEQQVKNISRPVRVYQALVQDESGASEVTYKSSADAADLASCRKPSLAVLPFINMSGDLEQEFFADGLTEDLISALSAWHYFPVVSRNSSFRFKGKAIGSRSIAQQLGARYLLEGSIRRAGDRIRVVVQLDDAMHDAQVWAGRFDRDLEDIFEVQDEIARRVAAVVAPELERAEERRIVQTPPTNFGAWESVQKGVALLHQFTQAGNADARTMFERAIQQDPNYSKAYSGLAYSYHRDIFWDYATERETWIQRFLDAAKRAVTLDDRDSYAHLVLGYAYIWAGEHDLAEAEEWRAVELHPGNAFAHVALGEAIDLAGRPTEAVEHVQTGIDLNTDDPRVHTFIGASARVHLNARDYEQAVKVGRRAMERRSDYPHANAYLISALGHLGRRDEAAIAFKRCPRLLPGFATAYRNPEDVEHYKAGLRKAGVLSKTS